MVISHLRIRQTAPTWIIGRREDLVINIMVGIVGAFVAGIMLALC